MSDTLTSTESKVYHYLLDFLTENTYQPSVREIGRKFKIKSTKTVSEILQALANKGYIERDPSRSRGVRLLGYQAQRRVQPVPYYGRIAAGEPALLPENRLGYITMDRRFLPSEDVFMLRVAGESMVGRGILDGDYVIVDGARRASDGDIVAARIREDATVKTLTHKDGKVVLRAANPNDRDIAIEPGDDFALLGRVCGVFRPFCEQPEPDAPLPS
jgi:repressor LexA